jgi:hypothetical protein
MEYSLDLGEYEGDAVTLDTDTQEIRIEFGPGDRGNVALLGGIEIRVGATVRPATPYTKLTEPAGGWNTHKS